ncbi:Lcl domain-containing protein [Chitinimonas sp. PSY-7]|uniref:Lcl domain-containing protein n=1 Tax=Chitinimonas sp. PSY-7 TaxID=3459088 RepID=UPI0040401A5C
MNRNHKQNKPTLLASLIGSSLLLGGCMGGGGNEAAPLPDTTSRPTASAEQTYSGRVVDGYIEGATVCLDLNRNGQCDKGDGKQEPQAITDKTGHYSFSVRGMADTVRDTPMLAEIPSGAVDQTLGVVATPYVLSRADNIDNAVISPFTTLVHASMQADKLDRAAATSKVATALGLPVELMAADFVARQHTKARNQAMLLTGLLGEQAKAIKAETSPAQRLWGQLQQGLLRQHLQSVDSQQQLDVVSVQTQLQQLIALSTDNNGGGQPNPVNPDPGNNGVTSSQPEDPLNAYKTNRFRKLAGNGDVLPAETVFDNKDGQGSLLPVAQQWRCIQDMREGVGKGAVWLRLSFQDEPTLLGGKQAVMRENLRQDQLPAFIAKANAEKWCGRSDWQLPTLPQLKGLNETSFRYHGKEWQATLDHYVFEDQQRLAATAQAAIRPHYWTASYEANALKQGKVDRLLYRFAWYDYTLGQGEMARDEQRGAEGALMLSYTVARLVAGMSPETTALDKRIEEALQEADDQFKQVNAKQTELDTALGQAMALQTVDAATADKLVAELIDTRKAWGKLLDKPKAPLALAERVLYQTDTRGNVLKDSNGQKLVRDGVSDTVRLQQSMVALQTQVTEQQTAYDNADGKIIAVKTRFASLQLQPGIDVLDKRAEEGLATGTSRFNTLNAVFTAGTPTIAELQPAIIAMRDQQLVIRQSIAALQEVLKSDKLSTVQQQLLSARLFALQRLLVDINALLPQAEAKLSALQGGVNDYQLLRADGSLTVNRSDAACARVIGDLEDTVWMLTDFTLTNRQGASIKGQTPWPLDGSYASGVDSDNKLEMTKALVDLARLKNLCGYSDWQLPKASQLETLLKADQSSLKDPAVFNDHDPALFYWTRDKSGFYQLAWRAPFSGSGNSLSDGFHKPKAASRLVRYVRQGAMQAIDKTGIPQAVKSDCFRHKATNKTWFLAKSGSVGWKKEFGLDGATELLDKANATKQCGLNAGWRTPSTAELLSIGFPALDAEDRALTGLDNTDKYWQNATTLANLAGVTYAPGMFAMGKALFVHD